MLWCARCALEVRGENPRWGSAGLLCASRRPRPSQPNPRLKLSARGGRLGGNGSVLSAAAAGRSLSAIR